MTTDTFCDVLDCAHNTRYTEGANKQRGGILFVAPPASLKTSIIEYVLDWYPNAFSLSNTNIPQLDALREEMISQRWSTMAFPEFAALYARDARTSASVEYAIHQLVDEGWKAPSFRDPRAATLKSRMLVIGGMTPTFYEAHFNKWQKSGFLRRFLVSLFAVENPEAITNAIKENRKLGLNGVFRKSVGANGIPFNVDREEADFLHRCLKEQPDDKTPLILLMRIYAVLKWKHGTPAKAKKVISDFAPTLKRDGGMLTLRDDRE